jgi:hypothetical protein
VRLQSRRSRKVMYEFAKLTTGMPKHQI